MKYDLSIICPSIRTQLQFNLFNSILNSIGNYSFELIIVGPQFADSDFFLEKNVRYIRDFGNISRCVQMASTIAESQFITWVSDDCTYLENTLSNCLDLIMTKNRGDGIIIQYYEGFDPAGQFDTSYWRAHTHPDQQLLGIPAHYWACPVGLYNLSYFQQIGGVDCRINHMNMNCHSLAFRVQNAGGTMYLSPDNPTMRVTFDNHTNPDHQILDKSHKENDYPIFHELYNKEYDPTFINIPYDNWKNSPTIWERFI